MFEIRASTLTLGLAALILAVAAAGRAQPPTAGPPGNARAGYVEIDGRKNPERIPEYMVWRQAFRSLAELESRKQTAALEADLPLSTREKKLVFDAARRQLEADRRCDARQRNVHAERIRGGAAPDEALTAVRGVILACRQDVLDAADVLVPALGSDAQVALRLWVDQRRAAIKVWVPKSDLPFFNKPR